MAIMRSRKVSPGFTVTRTMSQSDSTRVPPVTAEKSPPDSRITGADSPVMALSSTDATPLDHFAVRGHVVARLDEHDIGAPERIGAHPDAGRAILRMREFLRQYALLHAAQRRRLRLAAPFGERFGEIREQHREPQPQRDVENEPRRRLAVAGERL